ncbi:SH3-like domain-containing protein [Rubricella aquisinus]|uniref:SH3-like domain-containing protein n=1 Tax=Rubricella aquisinus TaxID=2028108 RepID=A0A840X8B2_9RHOB|nr:SH3 domain-containing protein [Rubricella aquisinus]MBB5516957.1 SH3-like domain-containing protein [Rubricella aquisinus]
MSRRITALIFSILLIVTPGFAVAQGDRGPVTGLDLPRYVSLKGSKGNVRRGPSFGHPIDWVFVRRGMPLRVTAEYDVWRRVEDHEGEGGWIHSTQISGVRTALVRDDGLVLRERPTDRGRPLAELGEGVIVRLDECQGDWCIVQINGIEGWAPARTMWATGR